MTVTQSYSLSLTYTSLRMYVPHAAPASVPTSSENKPPASAGDTVTLSPGATAPPAADEASTSTPPATAGSETASSNGQTSTSPVETTGTPAETPQTPPAATSRAARRAEVLLNALDADQDGAVTKEEFVDGAMALLRRAGARHHHRHHRAHGEGHDRHGHEGHGMRRLERKLDRLFDRVDDSGDGSVDQAELTDALKRVTREPRTPSTETPTPPAQETPSSETPAQPTVPQTPPAAAISYTSVTVVIAIKQYSSVAAMKEVPA